MVKTNKIKAGIISLAMLASAAATPLAFITPMVVNATGQTVTVNKAVTAGDSTAHTVAVNPTELYSEGDTLTSISVTYKTNDGSSATSMTLGVGIAVTDDCPSTIYTSANWWQGEGQEFTVSGSTFTVEYTVPADVAKYINYDATWGKVSIGAWYCNVKNLTLVSVKANVNGSGSETPDDPTEMGQSKSGFSSIVDNGDGTATVSSTLTGQFTDFASKTASGVLTQGADAESTDPEAVELVSQGLSNQCKISYADFGIVPSGATEADAKITIDSFTFTVSSTEDIGTFMYGGGMNVAYMSPADTEYMNGKSGYWYNDHGTEDTKDYGFEIGRGTTLKSVGKYQECYWEMPETVKENATVQPGDSVSFQYWYGDAASVQLVEATCTYTITETVPYSDVAKFAVGETLKSGADTTNNFKVDLADFNMGENAEVEAVVFNVGGNVDYKKLVGAFGISVNSDCPGYKETLWFQSSDFVALNFGNSAQIMWVIPSYIKDYVDVEYGNLFFGYWYGGDSEGTEIPDVTLDSIDVVYYNEPVETTTTTETTTTATTTTTPETTTKPETTTTKPETTTTATTTTTPETTKETTTTVVKPTMYGDVNLDGRVTVADVIMINKAMAGMTTLSAQQIANGDVTGDAKVNNIDGLKIMKLIGGLISTLDPTVK